MLAVFVIMEGVHPNFLFVPTLLGALIFCLLGIKVFPLIRSAYSGILVSVLALAMATPALLFAAYYGHIFDRALWFYTFRAAPYTELTAAGIGFGLGLIFGLLKQVSSQRNSGLLRLSAPVLAIFCGGLLMVPYMKPIVAPLEAPTKGRWSEDVALQSTPATCGPCSAATLMRLFNISASERELARECFSYRGGTENWYVARALERRGLQTRYIISSPENKTFPVPSIAGVQLGGAGGGGHFITLLGRSGESYIVGDPLVGRMTLTPKQLHSKYYFTGFFLTASKTKPVSA